MTFNALTQKQTAHFSDQMLQTKNNELHHEVIQLRRKLAETEHSYQMIYEEQQRRWQAERKQDS